MQGKPKVNEEWENEVEDLILMKDNFLERKEEVIEPPKVVNKKQTFRK